MKTFAGLAGAALALLGFVAPAMARDQYVIDNAHIFSAATVSSVNQKIADFNAQTGKEVVVDTEPTLGGQTPANAEEHIFAQQQVNGVLIFVAKSPKTIAVVPDRASHQFFPPGETASIRNAIRSGFNSGDFDGGITNGVDLTLGQYRSHLGSLRTRGNETVPSSHSSANSGGFSMSFIWLILILVVGFLIVRAIFRAMSRPPMYGPGPGGPAGPGYGPGYGPGPGYGGFGYGGGGGGFWSGLLGGLGGAWLGNELFNRGGGNFGAGGTAAGVGDTYTQQDASGWQSDAGQADMSNASSGSWGDSGGFDSGGGGGFDSGGGDFGGGGGGDSGGGW